ncbi:unnamed protein product [Notodromas monacha]|uniref:F-box domain-containing protein n=1 Tax=Notodromas monacha TaxID=399045 RepID=A0A7R9GIW4_9CRUS|nr:unnamed protein product [Notodromas monacha]CAG0924373.1 unnamed protein product [Notodromas monacha]
MPQRDESDRRAASQVDLSLALDSLQRRSCAYGSLPHHYKPQYSFESPSSTTSASTTRSNSTADEEEDGKRRLHWNKVDDAGVKADLMRLWFTEFSDIQRNAFLREMIELCGPPQIHTLSLLVEDQLHRDCPHNCKDFLAWLPQHVCHAILSHLDPVSLARASQVSHLWRELATNEFLWKKLCLAHSWTLKKPESSTWKDFFAMRWRVRKNWLSARCHIRTFVGHTHAVTCVQMDDTRIVSGSHDQTIKVWDVRTNSKWSVMTLVGHSGTVRCLQLLGGESTPKLVSGSSDGTIKVWDLAMKPEWSSIACRTTMVGHLETVRCLQADEERVISGSYDRTLKIWCIKTGRCLRTLTGHTGKVLTVFYDAADNTLISGSDDCHIKVWRMESGHCVNTLEGHTEAVTSLTLAAGDGSERRIISGSLDRTIKVWSLLSGDCLSTLDWMNSEGHTGVIRCLQADSWRIVSAADDKTIKMWSLESGKRLVTFRKHEDGVTCVHFNDFTMVSGSYDKTVKLWDFRVC